MESKSVYEKVYNMYVDWRQSKRMTMTSETLILAYFNKLADGMAPSTLSSEWSMPKLTIERNENINIDQYKKLKRLLKQKTIGFQSKRAFTFVTNQIYTFLNRAPDADYLDMKVSLILGILGAL
ncbi:hypothetical protein QAD02_023127 [Eretmocerus hayati]|uniref:Uncharacterized protein n=1 Tax=Eretmocerus hayati TaxID=131215 RepID=A0ACC2PW33_9HYME|nr:hypothetical protein QAD02_023127 [Eretmocerus hayati]